MKKTAPAKYAIHPLLAERWSPRAYSSKEIPTDIIQRLFEAARWAPSSSNDQEWRFIIGFKGDETYQQIFDTLVEFNRFGLAKRICLCWFAANPSAKKPASQPGIFIRRRAGRCHAEHTSHP
jgi:nitroreductase